MNCIDLIKMTTFKDFIGRIPTQVMSNQIHDINSTKFDDDTKATNKYIQTLINASLKIIKDDCKVIKYESTLLAIVDNNTLYLYMNNSSGSERNNMLRSSEDAFSAVVDYSPFNLPIMLSTFANRDIKKILVHTIDNGIIKISENTKTLNDILQKYLIDNRSYRKKLIGIESINKNIIYMNNKLDKHSIAIISYNL
jgi:hypothetical protein